MLRSYFLVLFLDFFIKNIILIIASIYFQSINKTNILIITHILCVNYISYKNFLNKHRFRFLNMV